MAEEKALKGYQRSYLLKCAHRLNPTVMIGRKGYGEAIVKTTALELAAHELIKVRFQDYKEEKRTIAEQLALDTGSMLIRVIGNIAILYREQEDPEKRTVRVPH